MRYIQTFNSSLIIIFKVYRSMFHQLFDFVDLSLLANQTILYLHKFLTIFTVFYSILFVSVQWRIQDFAGGAYYSTNFSRKLHENEDILAQRRTPLPPRSATAVIVPFYVFTFIEKHSQFSFIVIITKHVSNHVSTFFQTLFEY